MDLLQPLEAWTLMSNSLEARMQQNTSINACCVYGSMNSSRRDAKAQNAYQVEYHIPVKLPGPK